MPGIEPDNLSFTLVYKDEHHGVHTSAPACASLMVLAAGRLALTAVPLCYPKVLLM